MATVNIHEAKTHLSRLLERAQAGEQIIIAKAGVPLVELTPVRRMDIVFGALEGQFSISDEEWAASDVALTELWDKDLGINAPS